MKETRRETNDPNLEGLDLGERVAEILNLLVEGSSMRSITRVESVGINTVTRLLVDAGRAAIAHHDEHVRDVPSKRIQVDELWAFCCGAGGVSPEGPERSGGRAERVDTPPAPQLRRRSGRPDAGRQVNAVTRLNRGRLPSPCRPDDRAPTYPHSFEESLNISVSGALPSPTVLQCRASIPARCNASIHRGDRFHVNE